MNKGADVIRVSGVQPLTPHQQALYKAGEKLLIDSLETGREFCRFMITTSMAAIPTYLALLKILLPKDWHATTATGAIVLLPALLFLSAAIVSMLGYVPKTMEFSLDLPDDINRVRSKTIKRRHSFATIAVVIFVIGVVLGSALIVWMPGRLASPTKTVSTEEDRNATLSHFWAENHIIFRYGE
ncbi:MAG: hypothetical protein ACYTFW_04525 [Planctomycetota bacterium]|jgi:hypothetical protein